MNFFRRYPIAFVLAAFVFLLAVCLTAPLIGSQSLNFSEVWRYFSGVRTADGVIFFQVRLPRVLLAVITGASLSLAGVVFQALLRNPLATPYTLGVSSGGALGALFVIKFGWDFVSLGFSGVQLAAFGGSLATIFFVFLLSRRFGRLSIHTMILAGVTLSYVFSAMILILHYFADFTETQQMIRWMMGGLDIVNYGQITRSLPLLLLSMLALLGMGRSFNLISTSEESAISKGVAVAQIQKGAFIFASLITGTVVALSGPIGFVGLIVPHFLRLIGGPDHRYLMPASIFFGGAFLAAADTVARTILAPIDLPVGIITALMGGPFFLYLLIRQKPRF